MSQIRRRAMLASALGTAVAAPSLLRAQPAKPQQLIVRSWGGAWRAAMEAGVAASFKAQHGIEIAIDGTHQSEMKTRIWAAQAQRRKPPVHIMWDIADSASESYLRGACVDLTGLPELAGMNPVAIPTGVDGLPYINMYTYVFVLLYRSAAFGGGKPESWNALTDPRFKGRIALGRAGNGEIGVAPVAGGANPRNIEAEMDKSWDWLRRVRANDPLFGRDEDFTRWLQAGEIDLGVAILTNAVALKKQGIDAHWAVPREGSYYANDCLWVPKGLTDEETFWAKAYVNHAMTEAAQREWTGRLGLPGLRKGLPVPPEFVGDPAYPTTPEDFARLFTVPPLFKARNWSVWYARYREIMGI